MPKRPSAFDISFQDVPDEPEPEDTSPVPTDRPIFQPKPGRRGQPTVESSPSQPSTSRRQSAGAKRLRDESLMTAGAASSPTAINSPSDAAARTTAVASSSSPLAASRSKRPRMNSATTSNTVTPVQTRSNTITPGPENGRQDTPVRARTRQRSVVAPRKRYSSPEQSVQETAQTILWGEEDDAEDPQANDESKPVRDLDDFSFFKQHHHNNDNDDDERYCISLDEVPQRGVFGAGFAASCFLDEEDQGQEDGLWDDEEERREAVYLRLSEIITFSIDYTAFAAPLYVETQHAWYRLKFPSEEYRDLYIEFFKRHSVAQLVLSSTSPNSGIKSYDQFIRERYEEYTDPLFFSRYTDEELEDAIPIIKRTLPTLQDHARRSQHPILKTLVQFASAPQAAQAALTTYLDLLRLQTRLPIIPLSGDIDRSVLLPQNLTQTTVTSSICKDASPYFQEKFYVLGARPRPVDGNRVGWEKERALERLRELVRGAAGEREVGIGRERREKWLGDVELDGEVYKVGDTVLVAMDGDQVLRANLDAIGKLTIDNSIPEYFRFGLIISISRPDQTFHLRWLSHSSMSLTKELFNPQELFLTDSCSIDADILMRDVAGKVEVRFFGRDDATEADASGVRRHEFFCRLKYNDREGSFTSFDASSVGAQTVHPETGLALRSLNNCPCCRGEVIDSDSQSAGLAIMQNGTLVGVSRRSSGGGRERFHVNDFVLIKRKRDDRAGGPCRIGHVKSIVKEGGLWKIDVRWIGRVCEIAKDVLPRAYFLDERELYLTEEKGSIYLGSIIRICYIIPKAYLAQIPGWLSNSPDCFYFSYTFPSMVVSARSWARKRLVTVEDAPLCKTCVGDGLNPRIERMNEFLRVNGPDADMNADANDGVKGKQLRALDLCAGTGAFGFGMMEGMEGTMRVTHAVEISPSAARTYSQYSPETIVYNQCVNVMLRYAVKTHDGLRDDDTVPKQLYDQKTALPPPYKPGDIDVLICGLPCQPHSTLNMFQKAEDRKSNLLLNCLSHIDFLRPTYVFVENVRGFVRFRLNPVQESRYRVSGGIEGGGLKLFYHILIQRGYQVRCGLLQAAHYGVPQARVRFFLIAALRGHTLPELPQPFCSFPLEDKLEIRFTSDDHDTKGPSFRPLNIVQGESPHWHVTIEQAIGDLPEYDWKNPRPEKETQSQRQESLTRAQKIKYDCKHPGPGRAQYHFGPSDNLGYKHEPRTTFQQRARELPTVKLQHYTRMLPILTVERVVTLPLRAGADYHDLRADLSQWQFANPASAVARGGFRPGYYTRLDANGWFNTTVTNVAPTAKQCKIIHPYCRRILSVRELMRSQSFPDSFVIESINESVITIHRQIGNAVPWLVAKALGTSLKEAVFKDWNEAPVPEVEPSEAEAEAQSEEGQEVEVIEIMEMESEEDLEREDSEAEAEEDFEMIQAQSVRRRGKGKGRQRASIEMEIDSGVEELEFIEISDSD